MFLVLCCCTAGFSDNATRFSCAAFILARQSRCWALWHGSMSIDFCSSHNLKEARSHGERLRSERKESANLATCSQNSDLCMSGAAREASRSPEPPGPRVLWHASACSSSKGGHLYDDNGKALGFRKPVDPRVR